MIRGAACAMLVAAALLAAPDRSGSRVVQEPGAAAARDRLESAYRASNLGVARLEQFDFDGAIVSFRDALRIEPSLGAARVNLAIALLYAGQLDAARTEADAAATALPGAPQPPYVLGLIAKAQNRPDDAVAAFTRTLRLDATDAATKVNLAQLSLQQNDAAKAAALFKEAVDAEPYNVTAAYGLAMSLLRGGQGDAGRQAMQRFQTLRDSTYGVTYGQNYLQQGRYAEAIASTGAEAGLVDERAPAVVFADATPAVFRASAAGFTLADVNGDGRLDLLAVGSDGLRFYVNQGTTWTDGTVAAALERASPGGARAAVAGDYDNDGRADLFLLRDGGSRLLHQRPDGTFADVTAAAGIAASRPARSAAFVDVDHDGDLDILVGGWGGAAQLWRNNGNGTFTETASAAGVRSSGTHTVGIVPTDFDNHRDIDVLLVDQDTAPALLQNMRDGSFQDAAARTGLRIPAGAAAVAAGDVNKDSFTDLFFGRVEGPGVLALSDGRGAFAMQDAGAASSGAVTAQLFDYDNDGLLDLLVAGPQGAHLFRDAARRRLDVTRESGLAAIAAGGAAVRELAAGDLDGDGDSDVVALTGAGALRLWRNDGGNRQGAVRVTLAARVSNRSSAGTKVEMLAGSLRQKLETSATTPAVAPADLVFGLGPRRAADIVRVLWPSGILQTEIAPAAAAGALPPLAVTELDRKPSSCPFLFTWNGSRFEFITDFLGGGEMGDWVGPGSFNVPDPDEYVRIRHDQLQARGGRYELRITNELEEAMFLDRLQLVAVDHAADVDVFPNEGLREPPRPPFRLEAARDAHPPVAAVDDHGHDVRPQIASLDRRYVDDFATLPIRGYAETHTLTLDLGPGSERALLLLTGWTDYAFSTDNRAAGQAGFEMRLPSLQVKDARGEWKTVDANLGFPVGRPQTIPVDMTGRFLGPSREVRIVTSMRIYWDQILVAAPARTEPRVHRLDPAIAELGWRGFSAETSPDGREPYGYDYARVSSASPWKQPAGAYTRYGDVRALLRQTDDMFAIAGPGDEIAVSFDAASLPALAPGWTRTFLLHADGFSKEMNIGSATPDAIAPLPFHAMRRYPYGADEHYPRTRAYEAYLARYNTRTVASPVPSLDRSAAEMIPRR